jgi:hypothetical protein
MRDVACLAFAIFLFRRGFGRIMGDSAMVIMWPSRDAEAEDDSYASVTLSQRKAPYETMPLPDPDPPFVAALDLASTSVRCLTYL